MTDKRVPDLPEQGREADVANLSDHASVQAQLFMHRLLDRANFQGSESAILNGVLHGLCAVAWQLRQNAGEEPGDAALESIIAGQAALFLADMAGDAAMSGPVQGRA